MHYQPIEPRTRAQVEAAMQRDAPDELCVAVIAVGLHADDPTWATQVCFALARHVDSHVRGNAIMSLGHIARRFGNLDLVARSIIERGLREDDDWVRGHAHAAADDVEHFLHWHIPRPR